jgi:hypothetical protein
MSTLFHPPTTRLGASRLLLAVLLLVASTEGRVCKDTDVFTNGVFIEPLVFVLADYSATIPTDCTTLSLGGNIVADGVVSNHIGDEGAIAVAATLQLGNTAVTELDLHRNDIGVEGATAIAIALQVNTAITMLNLNWNNMGDAGVAAIAAALKGNAALIKLHLQGNSMGAAGAKAIGDALRENTALTAIGMYDNSIGDAGATAIAAFVQFNTALKTLDLGKNEIGVAGATAIAAALLVNTGLTELTLDNNDPWSTMPVQDSKEVSASINASLAENQDPQKVAAKAAWNAATKHRQSLLRAPCGSHIGCEQLVGAFIIEQLAHMDAAQLLNLGITSAVDLLVYTYDPAVAHAAAAADTHLYEDRDVYTYVTSNQKRLAGWTSILHSAENAVVGSRIKGCVAPALLLLTAGLSVLLLPCCS